PHIRVSALVALEKINEYYPDILEVSIKCLDDLVDNIKAAIRVFVKQASLTVLEGTLNNTLNPIPNKFIQAKRSSHKQERVNFPKTLFLENSAQRRGADIQTTSNSKQPIRGGSSFFVNKSTTGSVDEFSKLLDIKK
ncbi:MAG: hypothetical protein H0T84_10420, partial [Tatlockia sp.]|nr:hypothetical protein [Tatlockia sp.]